MFNEGPEETILILPFHVGSFKFQSAALQKSDDKRMEKSSSNSLLFFDKRIKQE